MQDLQGSLPTIKTVCAKLVGLAHACQQQKMLIHPEAYLKPKLSNPKPSHHVMLCITKYTDSSALPIAAFVKGETATTG
jgi:hypothetical protein